VREMRREREEGGMGKGEWKGTGKGTGYIPLLAGPIQQL
jgi:hypothetical protein